MPRARAALAAPPDEQPQSSTPVWPALMAVKASVPAPAAPERIQGVRVIVLLAEATPVLRGLYVMISTGLAAAAAPAGLNRIESTNLEFAPVLFAWRFQLEVTLLISSSEDTPSAAIDVLAGSTRPRPSVMRVRTM